MMQERDFPALYLSANDLSSSSQTQFFRVLGAHLVTLIVAATLSVVSVPHWWIAVLQAIALLGALSCSIYLFNVHPERRWYGGRAVAESIKTITWRYVSRAEPFQGDDDSASRDFLKTLRAIVEQNQDLCRALSTYLGGIQITPAMSKMRSMSLADRKKVYREGRVNDQLNWYAKKARYNRDRARNFFWGLIAINAIALISSLIRIANVDIPFWPTDIFVAAAASLLGWIQAKRFSELAASYSLTAHEIAFVMEESLIPDTEEKFSIFVGDAENAFSREHTQWVARKDV